MTRYSYAYNAKSDWVINYYCIMNNEIFLEESKLSAIDASICFIQMGYILYGRCLLLPPCCWAMLILPVFTNTNGHFLCSNPFLLSVVSPSGNGVVLQVLRPPRVVSEVLIMTYLCNAMSIMSHLTFHPCFRMPVSARSMQTKRTVHRWWVHVTFWPLVDLLLFKGQMIVFFYEEIVNE